MTNSAHAARGGYSNHSNEAFNVDRASYSYAVVGATTLMAALGNRCGTSAVLIKGKLMQEQIKSIIGKISTINKLAQQAT